MAFADMAFELAGELNLPMPLVQTKLNEALGQIFDDEEQQMWSFQIREADNWLTPGLLFASGFPAKRRKMWSQGMIHAEPFSDKIIGSRRAARAWQRHKGRPLITELQIRSPFFSLYNIIDFDGDRTLTLDRPWMEPVAVPRQLFPWGWWDEWEAEECEEDGDHDRHHPFWQPYMMYQAYFPTPTADFKR